MPRTKRDGLILTNEDGNCILVRADGDELPAVLERASKWADEEGYVLTAPAQVRLQWIRAVPCPEREHSHQGWLCDRGPGTTWMPCRKGRGAFQGVLADVTLNTDEIVALCTLQFASGGLIGARPVDDYAVHLVRQNARQGTPGPTLCGIDRFHPDSAGWSVGGGISGPDVVRKPCPGCAGAARSEFPGLPVSGLGAKEMGAVLGVPWRHWGGTYRQPEKVSTDA